MGLTTMLKTTSFKILSFSDVHLFHDRVPTSVIIPRLQNRVTAAITEEGKIDYLIIAGDLFDRARLPNEDPVQDAVMFMFWLMGVCKSFNIKLRVMEGTPSHDRGQPVLFKTLFDAYRFEESLDFKYVPVLSYIEEEDGLTWVYVPDEIHHDCSKVYDDVHKLIRDRGQTQVDVIVTHGLYDIHVGNIPTKNYHIADQYCALARHLVINGHIHTSSIYQDKMLTNGSFDRLRHGEEEQKGLWVIQVLPEKNVFKFYVNEEAEVFDTVSLIGVDYEDALAAMRKKAQGMSGGNLCIVVDEALREKGLLRTLSDLFPNINWSKKDQKIADLKDNVFEESTEIEKMVINRGNIAELINARLSVGDGIKQTCQRLLADVLASQ